MKELLEILNELKPGVDFTQEENIVERGILTSMDIVRLVVELNDTFDIELTPIDIVPQNFFSAKTIYALVEKLQEE